MKCHWLLMVIPIIVCSGCGPNFRVTLDPRDVPIKELRIDGVVVHPEAEGKYKTQVRFQSNEDQRNVIIELECVGGVRLRRSPVVGKRSAGAYEETIKIPAQIQVTIDPPNQPTRLFVDARDASALAGPIDVASNRGVSVVVKDNDGVERAKQTVEVSPGELRSMQLSLNPKADFAFRPQQITLGLPVTFDASGSSPTGSVTSYEWEFGDGTPKEPTRERQIQHEFKVSEDLSIPDEFFVSLVVTDARGKRSEKTTHPIPVTRPEGRIAFNVTRYPDEELYEVGERIVFRIEPRNRSDMQLVTDAIKLEFETTENQHRPYSGPYQDLDRSELERGSVVVAHTFDRRGRFEPRLCYQHRQLDDRWESARLEGDAVRPVMVFDRLYSDCELTERAWHDAYVKLRDLLEPESSTKASEPGILKNNRLAITSIEDANFEASPVEVRYPRTMQTIAGGSTDESDLNRGPRFVEIVERLTRFLVDDGYVVLERGGQVLSRLGAEAVVDVRRGEDDEHLAACGEHYRDELEYGVIAKHYGLALPITYSVAMAGTDARVRKFGVRGEQVHGQDEVRPEEGEALDVEAEGANARLRVEGDTPPGTEQVVTAAQESTAWAQDFPMLVARFRTAQLLIAIRMLEETVESSKTAVDFDGDLTEPIAARIATVRFHVRVIDREGRILAAKEITGRHEMRIPERFPSAQPSCLQRWKNKGAKLSARGSVD